MSLLREAILQDYGDGTENRLSQVLAAAFNNSETFRDVFLTFLNLKSRAPGGWAVLREKRFEKGRVDLRVDSAFGTIAVIECKLESPVSSPQLANMQREFPKARRFLITKYRDHGHRPPKAWGDHLIWRDLAEVLARKFGNGIDEKSRFSRRIGQEVLAVMKAFDVGTTQKISQKDIACIAKFATELRYKVKPSISTRGTSAAEALWRFECMAREAIAQIKATTNIVQITRKKDVRPLVRYGFQFDPAKKGRLTKDSSYDERIDVYQPFFYVAVELLKPRYGVKRLCFAMEINRNGKANLATIGADSNWHWDSAYDVIPFNRNGIIDSADLAKFAIKTWRKYVPALKPLIQ